MTRTAPQHIPVMPSEVLAALKPHSGGRYVDVTLGDGGHSRAVLEASGPDGSLLALDRDAAAIADVEPLLAPFGSRVRCLHSSFGRLRTCLAEVGWEDGADGILADLGVSTAQILGAERGFSFSKDGPLDMRMDQTSSPSAADLVAVLEEGELADLIYRYGDERASRRIAKSIVRRRTEARIETTAALRSAVIAAGVRGKPGRDPATKTFQALRIAVNDELGELETLLEEGWTLLRPGGRLVFLTYHSLEDRLVKQAFRTWASKCICAPEQPICVCGWEPKVRFVVRGKQKPDAAEIERNPRARSAGLRAVERLPDHGEAS